MHPEPEIKLLSYKKRKSFFFFLLTIFLILFPVFIFYSSGYRISFEDRETAIISTGGIYVTTDNLEVDVYIDEDRVERPRLFRNAYYIQNLNSGTHRVVVQGIGLQTWVKQLPVDANIVTEAAAFNMPLLPHIRPIPPYFNQAGQALYIEQSTSTDIFRNATTTIPFVVVTRAASSTLRENSEYEFVRDLFIKEELDEATSTTLIGRLEEELDRFRFSTTTPEVTATTTESVYVERGTMRLLKRGEDLFARFVGQGSLTPHYFCSPQSASSTISDRLGEHVAVQFEEQSLSTTTPLHIEGSRICRTEIRIDRKWQEILYYAFLPGSSDLVVMQLQDGLYITEIDDRSWQNTQMVYPGLSFKTIVTDTNIYIMEDGRYFELLTVLPETNQ